MTAFTPEHARESVPRAMAVIERGVRDGLHLGAQLYASLDARPVVDIGIGINHDAVPLTRDSMFSWYSATKAVTNVAFAMLWQAGSLDPDDLVAAHIPEYAQRGKERVRIRHLLTHTAGVLFVEGMGRAGMAQPPFQLRYPSWVAFVGKVFEAPIAEGWVPGSRAMYHGGNNYSVLTELLMRAGARPYDEFARSRVLEPVGAVDSYVGMPDGAYARYGERIGTMHNITASGPRPAGVIDSPEASRLFHGGGSGRGPIRELAHVYEMLLRRGDRILRPQTVEAITARHRTGLVDERWGIVCDWGLGFAIDRGTYGRHSSPRTFGHGGGMNSNVFCDPESALVVGMLFNGNVAGIASERRFRDVASALYEDLGLADAAASGREHPMPARVG